MRRWRREAGSWFQRRGEAYWKERSVIRREDDVGGRASVTRDENFRALYKNACFLSTLVFVYYLWDRNTMYSRSHNEFYCTLGQVYLNGNISELFCLSLINNVYFIRQTTPRPLTTTLRPTMPSNVGDTAKGRMVREEPFTPRACPRAVWTAL